jgi:DNA polymerase
MERFVGKVCVLGLGFQMGAAKLQMTLAKGALGGPPVFFTLEQCQKIVAAYRRKNHRIEAGWDICKRIIEDMAAGRTGRHGPISWEKETLWLPNGMSLKYPKLTKSVNDKGWDEWSYQSGDIRKKIYGGLLCENIVQALARIVVAWQMLNISRKYRVVMTTHDEVVACPKTAAAETCYRYMYKWMTTAPHWCPDIPLAAEGGWAENYSK